MQHMLENYRKVAFLYDTEQDGTFSDGVSWANQLRPGQTTKWNAFASGTSDKIPDGIGRGKPLFGFWYTSTGGIVAGTDVEANSLTLRTERAINAAYQDIWAEHVDALKDPTQATALTHTVDQYWPNFIILDFVEENPLAQKICVTHAVWLHLMQTPSDNGNHLVLSNNLPLKRGQLFTLVETGLNTTHPKSHVTAKLRALADRIEEEW